MRKLRLMGLLTAVALLSLQSCKKNEPAVLKDDAPALGVGLKKGLHWNPGDVVINGKYRFVQYQNPSKAVCVVGNSTLEGAKLHHWSYASQGTGQQWNIVNRTTVGGVIYYTLSNVNSSKVM